MRYYARPEILFQVSRGSLLPAPNVDSTVIRLNVLSQPPVSVYSEQTFFALVRASFGQRRKTLCNAVSAGMGIPKEKMCIRDSYWDVRFDLNEAVKKSFDEHSIEIPFPQLDVHLQPDSTRTHS